MDEIFEYVPPSAAAPEDAAPPPDTEGLDTAPLVSSEEAFRAAAAGLARDAAGRALHGGRAPQRSAFEHPRLKLARLRRETDELSKDLAAAPEAYDGRTAAALGRARAACSTICVFCVLLRLTALVLQPASRGVASFSVLRFGVP